VKLNQNFIFFKIIRFVRNYLNTAMSRLSYSGFCYFIACSSIWCNDIYRIS